MKRNEKAGTLIRGPESETTGGYDKETEGCDKDSI